VKLGALGFPTHYSCFLGTYIQSNLRLEQGCSMILLRDLALVFGKCNLILAAFKCSVARTLDLQFH
jgi:hypothetical protein